MVHFLLYMSPSPGVSSHADKLLASVCFRFVSFSLMSGAIVITEAKCE